MAAQIPRPSDEELLRETFELANLSVKHNNQPFGAILVNENGEILYTAENTELTGDTTGHAEMNLVRAIDNDSVKLSKEELAKCTIYTSTEPCMMCCGAVDKLGVLKLVFGCSAKRMSEIIRGVSPQKVYSCRNVLQFCKRQITVEGPVFENDAEKVHINYWPNKMKQ